MSLRVRICVIFTGYHPSDLPLFIYLPVGRSVEVVLVLIFRGVVFAVVLEVVIVLRALDSIDDVILLLCGYLAVLQLCAGVPRVLALPMLHGAAFVARVVHARAEASLGFFFLLLLVDLVELLHVRLRVALALPHALIASAHRRALRGKDARGRELGLGEGDRHGHALADHLADDL